MTLPSKDESLYNIRSLRESDLPFLFNSYLKSYRPYFQHLGNDDFYALHHERLNRFILSGAIGAIAVAKDDDDVILGWTLVRVDPIKVVFFYTYIKHPFRSLRMATQLVESISFALPNHVFVTAHMTPGGAELLKKLPITVSYNPYILEMDGK